MELIGVDEGGGRWCRVVGTGQRWSSMLVGDVERLTVMEVELGGDLLGGDGGAVDDGGRGQRRVEVRRRASAGEEVMSRREERRNGEDGGGVSTCRKERWRVASGEGEAPMSVDTGHRYKEGGALGGNGGCRRLWGVDGSDGLWSRWCRVAKTVDGVVVWEVAVERVGRWSQAI